MIDKNSFTPQGSGVADQLLRHAINDGYMTTGGQLEDTVIPQYPADNRYLIVRGYQVLHRSTVGGINRPTSIRIVDLVIEPRAISKHLTGYLNVIDRSSSVGIVNPTTDTVELLRKEHSYNSSVEALYSVVDLSLYDVPGRLPLGLIDTDLNSDTQTIFTLDFASAAESTMPLSEQALLVGEIPLVHDSAGIVAAMKAKIGEVTHGQLLWHRRPDESIGGSQYCSAANCPFCDQLNRSVQRAEEVDNYFENATNEYLVGEGIGTSKNRAIHESRHIVSDIVPALEVASAVLGLSMVEDIDLKSRLKRRACCFDE